MSVRPRRPLATISAAVVGVLLLALYPSLSLGQTGPSLRDQCTTIEDTDIRATAAGTTPSLTSFPVVVHYMKHVDEPTGSDSKARSAFPLNKVKAFFKANGDFNKVWAEDDPKVTFVLVGVETCIFKLGDGTSPLPDEGLMRQMGDAYNIQKVVLASGHEQRFKGLDLYLWTDIQGEVGGFARSAAAMKRPSVWLAPDCIRGNFCAREFAHEIGHFFGLCHVCTNRTREGETTPGTCRQTCQPEGQANQSLDSCDLGERRLIKRLMADLEGTDLSTCERGFAVGNAERILTSTDH